MYTTRLKRYRFSLLSILAIWILCLGPVPHAPELEDVPFIDKWVHTAMYLGTCSIIWIEYLISHRKSVCWMKVLVWAVLAPALMSGLIEIIQQDCTGGRRSGDILDFAANSLGVVIAAIIGSTAIRAVISRLRH